MYQSAKRLQLFGISAALVALLASPVAAQHGGGGLATNADVLETMSSGGYTYVRVVSGDREIWAAGPETPVKVGDHVTLGAGAMMRDFQSKSLGRTFPVIYFVDAIQVGDGPHGGTANPRAAGAIPHAGMGSNPAPGQAVTVASGSIPKAEGGSTVAELFGSKAEISGKEVMVRGKIVKFNANIMGRNWLHIQDGSGKAGSNDLTVTTSAIASVGDVVLVRGTATLDKDFGAGYRYDLIVEDASLTVE